MLLNLYAVLILFCGRDMVQVTPLRITVVSSSNSNALVVNRKTVRLCCNRILQFLAQAADCIDLYNGRLCVSIDCRLLMGVNLLLTLMGE